ncbi:hypothetical protein [Faunimonas sp. B44]|uniref:hypothetical protein n=1 Tax=Faunimonas sp. B44 TaxID=3461493 RepID=UPI004043C8F4
MADMRVSDPLLLSPVPPEERRLPIGAEPMDGGTSFRVWAPARDKVSVIVQGLGDHALAREPSGHFSGFVPGAGPGGRYGSGWGARTGSAPIRPRGASPTTLRDGP